MSAKKKVPAIRFQGFSEEWEEKMLGDIVTFVNGRAYSQNELLTNGKYKVLRVGNFYTNDFWYYSDMELSDKYYANTGDLLYTWSASFGPHIWQGGKVIYHYHIWKLLLSYNFEKKFLIYLLTNDREKILADSNGSTMIHITKVGMEKKNVLVPAINEQTKIGNFFQQLDSLISQQQKKHEKLQNLKKALLQKMFPLQGQSVPQLRSQGFRGKWEEEELGEIAEFNPKAELPDFFQYVDLESVSGTEMVSHRIESKVLAPSRAQRLARKGDVFYQTVRPYQKNNYLFNMQDNNFVFSTGYAQIRPIGDSYFLFSSVQNEDFVKIVLDNCTGTSYPAINSNDLAKIIRFFPENKEQTKIGNFFQQLDKLLSQQQAQLEKLKNIKKACLEKMFV